MQIMNKEHSNLRNVRAMWESVLSKTRQVTCANAILGLKQTKNNTEKHIYDFKLTSGGCKNRRRDGSKFCQDCSDNFKKLSTREK